ncbi:transposable element Tcb2 transposase [Trichonephila clavipes]|nr:transposable element Tcb2 transposase [Trichonephila clavipes]
MNPIEHVWDALGRRVAGHQPPRQTLQELERALLEEWDRIPQLVINSLIDSMPQRFRETVSFKIKSWHQRQGVSNVRTIEGVKEYLFFPRPFNVEQNKRGETVDLEDSGNILQRASGFMYYIRGPVDVIVQERSKQKVRFPSFEQSNAMPVQRGKSILEAGSPHSRGVNHGA